MNDEKELKEELDFSSEEVKKVVKKAKLFTVLRNVVITLVVLVILGIAIFISNLLILDRMARNVWADEYIFNQVARPNSYISEARSKDGFLAGEMEFVTYRIVGKRAVCDGTYIIKYIPLPIISGIYGHSALGQQLAQIGTEDGEQRYYNRAGNREMMFYHPEVEYKNYKNDLKLLEEIENDKYIEMALSFNQDYSVEAVKELLPDKLTQAWYWVDSFSKGDLDGLKGHYAEIEITGQDGKPTVEKIYHEPQALHTNEVYNKVYGMKAITNTGEEIEDPCNSFIRAIEYGTNNKSRYQTQFQELYNKLSDNNGKISRDNIRVIGVVVTGDASSLGLLKDADYIKASSLGIVVNKY
ncbi:MAG: anti sigma factor C-terminal domain-containing protein [Actinomycetota bacterium]|nr:anti sigma factor C-terminal domain-containing protein [Actinomycetota bacterium]